MSIFTRPICPEDIAALIDLTIESQRETASMATLQREGVAALYNILCERRVAYLADEVGMGKTYQALALSAIVWSEAPGARILFISPRENLQVKWFDDYKRFFSTNYRRSQVIGDDRVISTLFGEPIHRPILYDNLRDWSVTIGAAAPSAPMLRHTSFMRPIYVTSDDARDLDALWARVVGVLRGGGLSAPERPEGLAAHNASQALNLVFAQALNARLREVSGGRPYFDLVIVDEAQCLRHPENQTNTVLYEALRDQVDRWLFMSATPAHGGPRDICAVVNHYPCAGQQLDPQLTQDLPAMQAALQAFMVRRQRRYQTVPAPVTVGKDAYRAHQAAEWAVQDESMSALGTLAMGLVQKELVGVLRGRNNRYQIGFLSSFESLQSSLAHAAQRADEDETRGDWHHDQTSVAAEAQAPDADFIKRHAEDFTQRFGVPLPHPKLDAVVERVAPLAFGAEDVEGGHKTLIFTRRVSTVAALRERLTARYLDAVKARVLRCWGEVFDWREGPGLAGEEHEASEAEDALDGDAESEASEASDGPLRAAMAEGGWLFRYRQTFRASGRNALCFEDGWLLRLCQAGGVAPETAAERLSDAIWAESWTHASRVAGARRQQHRAARLRYIAAQSLLREPHIFGLDAERASPWRAAYEAALHAQLARSQPAEAPHHDPKLFAAPTLWTAWDGCFTHGPLVLPGADPRAVQGAAGQEALCMRQVARTALGQTFRLTDTLIDLFYADKQARAAGEGLEQRFLRWLASDDMAARALRRECGQWLAHLRLIVDGCLDGAGRTWRELAREETWPQLFSASPVVGVTGSSGPQRKATSQFRTPSLPRVIVCTDTLKEGVDLHTFCDRVVHYGVAWTSGDLEQRVGRVDRFFSQIERRLIAEGAPPAVQLTIGYPHIVSSLERAQIERVIARQRDAERLMDSPLAAATQEARELVVGASAARAAPRVLEPYNHAARAVARRPIAAVDVVTARAAASHYERWYALLCDALRARGWQRSPDDPKPSKQVTLFGHGRSHTLSWGFDAALGRYILTLSDPPLRGDGRRSGVRRHLVGRAYRDERFIQALVPTPGEGHGSMLIGGLLDVLSGAPPREDQAARVIWEEARVAIAAPAMTLSAYEGGLCLVIPLAAPDARLDVWLKATTHTLPSGYLALDPDAVVFGAHLLHDDLSAPVRAQLLATLAREASRWREQIALKSYV